MRKVKKEENLLLQVVCNSCGKELVVKNGMLMEGCFHGVADFGYFSKKDLTVEEFDLCEDCYEKMTSQFRVPVSSEECREAL